MSISGKIMHFTTKNREVLMKLVPIGLLRSIKKRMILRNLKRLEKEGREAYDPEAYPQGINLIGDVRAEIGLGQSARLLAGAIGHTKIPYTIYQESMGDDYRAEDHSLDEHITQTLPYGINLLHINPYELMYAYTNMDAALWDKRYNIGYWLWELEEFPEEWKRSFLLVDEVWTPSEFISRTLRKIMDVPVYTVPYAVTAPTDPAYNRAYFGLPEDRFLYLVMYDCNSTMARKNPLSAIEAYRQAFITDSEHAASYKDRRPALVIKVNNASAKDMEQLERSFDEDEEVYYITNTLSKTEVNSLIADMDVFVSLHRAEGFGLVMAEAMLNHTVCIATNWSANTEFMNEETACMVSYDMVEIQTTTASYQKGFHWAEPDVTEAAGYMWRLYQDKDYYEALADAAEQYIRKELGMELVVTKIEERIQEIYENAKG